MPARHNFIDNILNRPSQSYAGQDPSASTTKWSAPSDLPNAPQSKSILSGSMFQGTSSLSKASSRGAGGSSWGGGSTVFSAGSRFGRKKKTAGEADDDASSVVGGQSNAGSQATTSRKSRWWEGGSLRRSRAPSISGDSVFSEPSQDAGGYQSMMTGVGAGSGGHAQGANTVHVMSATPGYRSTRSDYGGDGVTTSHKRGSIVPPLPKHSPAALRSLTSDASTTAQLTHAPAARTRMGSAPGVKVTPNTTPSRLKSFVSNPDMAGASPGASAGASAGASSGQKAHRKSAHGGSNDWRDFMQTMEKRDIARVWNGGAGSSQASSSDAGGVHRRRSVKDRVQRELQQDAQFESEQREEGQAVSHGNLLAQAAAMVVGQADPSQEYYEQPGHSHPDHHVDPYVPTGLRPGTIIIEPGHQLYPAATSQDGYAPQELVEDDREGRVRSPISSAHDSRPMSPQSAISHRSPSLPRAVLDRDLPPPPPAAAEEPEEPDEVSSDDSSEEEEPDRLAIVEEEEEGSASSHTNHELRQQPSILGRSLARKPSRHEAFDRILSVVSPPPQRIDIPPPASTYVQESKADDSSEDGENTSPPPASAQGKGKSKAIEPEGQPSVSDTEEALSASSTDADSKNIKFEGNGSIASGKGVQLPTASVSDSSDSDSDSDESTSTEGDDSRSRSSGAGASDKAPVLQRRLSDLSLGGSFAVSQIMRTGVARSRRSGSVRSGSASSRRVRIRSGDSDSPRGSDASEDDEKDDASLRARIKAEQDRLRMMSVGDDFFGSTLSSMFDAVGIKSYSTTSLERMGGLDLAVGSTPASVEGGKDKESAKRDSILELNAEKRMVEVRKKRAALAAAATATEQKSAPLAVPANDNDDAQSFAASEFAPSYAAAYFALAGDEAPPVPPIPAAAPAAASAEKSSDSPVRSKFTSLFSHSRTLSGGSSRSRESPSGFPDFSLGLSFGGDSAAAGSSTALPPKQSMLDRPRTRVVKPTTMGGVEVSVGKLLAESPQATRSVGVLEARVAEKEKEEIGNRSTLPFKPSEVKIGAGPVASPPPVAAVPPTVVTPTEPLSKDKPPPVKSALKAAPVKSLADTLFSLPSAEPVKKTTQKTAVVLSPASVAGSIGALSDEDVALPRTTTAPSAWSTKEQDKKVAKVERRAIKAIKQQQRTDTEAKEKRERKERKRAKKEQAALEAREKELKQRAEEIERKEKAVELKRQEIAAAAARKSAEEHHMKMRSTPSADAPEPAAPSKTRLSRGPSVRSARSVDTQFTAASSSGDERYATPEAVTPAVLSPASANFSTPSELGPGPHSGQPAETALFGRQAEQYHSGFDLRELGKSSISIRSDETAHQETVNQQPSDAPVPESPHMPGGFLYSASDDAHLTVVDSSAINDVSPSTSEASSRSGVSTTLTSPIQSDVAYNGTSPTIKTLEWADKAPVPVLSSTGPSGAPDKLLPMPPPPSFADAVDDTALRTPRGDFDRTPSAIVRAEPSFGINLIPPTPPALEQRHSYTASQAPSAAVSQALEEDDESEDDDADQHASPRSASRQSASMPSSALGKTSDSTLTRSKSSASASRRKSVRKSVVYDGNGMLSLPNGLVATTVASSNDARSRHSSNDSELTMIPSAERKKSLRRGSKTSSESEHRLPVMPAVPTAPVSAPSLSRATSTTSTNSSTLQTSPSLRSTSSTPPVPALPMHVNVHMQPAPGHYRDSPPQSLSPYAASSAGSDGSNSPAPSVSGSRSVASSNHSTASRSVASLGSARSVASRSAASVASDTSSRDVSPHSVPRSARTLSAGQTGNARPTLRMSSINEWESSVPNGADSLGTSPSWSGPESSSPYQLAQPPSTISRRSSAGSAITPAVVRDAPIGAPTNTYLYPPVPKSRRGSLDGEQDGSEPVRPTSVDGHTSFPAYSVASSGSQASQSAISLPSVPMSSYRPNKDPTRSAGTIDERLYARTTMSTISVASGAFRKQAKHKKRGSMDMGAEGFGRLSLDVPEHLADEINQTHIALTSHTPPPRKISSTQVLVQIIAVAVDEMDRLLLREKIRSDDAYGWVPGRSFCGRIMEAGWECKRVRKGDIVFGLQESRKCGALAEFMTIDHNLISKAPEDCLTTEQIAALPSAGVMSYQIMQNNCSQLPRGARVLILNAHDGIGLLTMQGCVGLGLIIVAQAPPTVSDAVAVCEANGAHEVVVGGPLWALNSLHESSFDLVIDTIGGRRIYDAARRILAFDGQFTTCFGDEHSMANPNLRSHLRSLRRAFFKKDKKNIGYEWVGLDGSTGGEDCRQALDAVRIAAEKGDICPRLSSILPFADAPRAFDPVTRGVDEEPGAIVVRVS